MEKTMKYVVVKYTALQKEREKEGKKRLESGIREKLVETAIEIICIEGKFDVPKHTIFSRIDLDRLKVWHPGTESPLLVSFILTAHRLYCPLDVGDVIALMNALISGTVHEKRVIAWKRTHCCYNADSPLVSHKWFWNFCNRNPNLWSQKAHKYA
jgi:hypothetical protein